MQKKIVPVEGVCGEQKKRVGFQFLTYDGVCEAVGSFEITPGGEMKNAGDLRGNFLIGQSYKTRGCKLCGKKFLYQCGNCKKLICYDGMERRNVPCPACGKVLSIPAAKDDRIIMSGNFGGKAKILLAMDVSGSMSGGRIEETKQAAIFNFIRKFQGCEMALVTFGNNPSYGSEVRTELGFTADSAAVERAVSSLTANWGTPSPFPHILANFGSFINGSGNRYVVVFTDGEWSSGDHVGDVNRIKQNGVKIIAIGCAGANTAFLSSIASPDSSISVSDGSIGAGFMRAAELISQS